MQALAEKYGQQNSTQPRQWASTSRGKSNPRSAGRTRRRDPLFLQGHPDPRDIDRPADSSSRDAKRPPERESNAGSSEPARPKGARVGARAVRDYARPRGDELGIQMLRRLGKQVLRSIAERRNIRGHRQMSEDELARSVYESFEE